MKAWIIAAASLLCSSQLALAEPEVTDHSGAYLGAGLGTANIYSNTCATDSGFFSSCSTEPSRGPKDTAHFSLVGGYDFNRHFGIEGGFSQLGTYRVLDYGGSTVGEFKASAYTLAFKAVNTFSKGLSVFGKFGFASVNTKYSAGPGWTLVGGASQKSTGLTRGVIGQYNINSSVGVRMSLEIIDYTDAEFENILGGVAMMVVFKL